MDGWRDACRCVVVACACGLLGACTSEPEWTCRDSVDPSQWTTEPFGKGIRLRTTHFDLRITATDEILREYLGAFMETAFCEYEQMAPPARTLDKRLVIYLFDTRNEWADFTRQRFPHQASTYLHILSGGYTDYASATAVAFDLKRDHTLALLAHEGMHQYFSRCFPRPIAPWLNEGLACQWEAFDLDGPYPIFNPRMNFSRRNHLREALAEDGALIPLRQLLRMDAGMAVREIETSVRTYYAQVWSMVLYLREGDDGKYTERLQLLLHDLGSDASLEKMRAYREAHPEAARDSAGELLFKTYITDDLDTFAFEYREFARRLVG